MTQSRYCLNFQRVAQVYQIRKCSPTLEHGFETHPNSNMFLQDAEHHRLTQIEFVHGPFFGY